MAAQDSLKVAAIFGRTASGSATGVPDLDQEEVRFAATALLRPGYLPSMIDQTANTSAFNVRQDTGANMQLKIGSGTTKKDGYVILGPAGQGAYIVRLDATTKTITVPATDATNPARYGVYLYVDDAAYSGTASRAYAQVSCIRGTPAGSPTTPAALATYSAYVLLWEFQLAANATAVTNTILDAGTDRRQPASGALGPLILYKTSAVNQSSIGTTETDITFTASGNSWRSTLNHLYEVTLSVLVGGQSNSDAATLSLQTGASGAGTVFAEAWTYAPAASANRGTGQLTGYLVGTGATMTAHARAKCGVGSFSLFNSTVAGYFTVKDLGPVTV